jgi:hypothetical protein
VCELRSDDFCIFATASRRRLLTIPTAYLCGLLLLRECIIPIRTPRVEVQLIFHASGVSSIDREVLQEILVTRNILREGPGSGYVCPRDGSPRISHVIPLRAVCVLDRHAVCEQIMHGARSCIVASVLFSRSIGTSIASPPP